MDIRICIDVGDIEEAIRFYTAGLGLKAGRRLKSDWAELLGGPCAIDLLCEAPGSPPLGEAHPQRRDYARHWTPVHLDFVVQDIEAAVRRAVE
ncbi:MAG TPA: VOC family protein, partial [Ramlibacter sp.]|nr:VOC family protein [Ramlibacter sp.]